MDGGPTSKEGDAGKGKGVRGREGGNGRRERRGEAKGWGREDGRGHPRGEGR